MTKNTGMTAKDEKAAKTAKLPVAKTNALNKKLQKEKTASPTTKTIQMVKKAKDIKNTFLFFYT